MNFSALFVHRPVATMLISLGIFLAGVLAYFSLPIASLPQVDFPTIAVDASLPGASAETMAATVATPLERSLGRIAGVSEITSRSSLGSVRVTLQFELSKNINQAAREVQAAINAARPLLPSGLPSNPTYRKVNPAEQPILIMALTSKTLSRGQLYDAASTVLAQRLSQIDGVGQVTIGGGALPAVRVDLDPKKLAALGLSLEQVRTAIASTNTNRPVGEVEGQDQRWQIGLNNQLRTAEQYEQVVIRVQNTAVTQLKDVAQVSDSVQDNRNFGAYNGQPAVVLIVNRSPGANVIGTVDHIRTLMPELKAMVPPGIDLQITLDRTPVIRGSLLEVQKALVISVGLVLLVVLLFLRKLRAALVPTLTIPISLVGTCSVMYLCGYSLDNLSLMALTVATGFVVDDAIVVQENIHRHLEKGLSPLQATLKGTREIGFTVLSMSLSLIAVFIPILLMDGVVGRLFREFAVTLSAAIVVSLWVSLTLTPSLTHQLMQMEQSRPAKQLSRMGRFFKRCGQWLEWLIAGWVRAYQRSLSWCLHHSLGVWVVLLATIALNVVLYIEIPKGFFPQQDTGRIGGFIRADESISYQAMEDKLKQFMDLVKEDPAVLNVVGFTGGGRRNAASMFIALKPLRERDASINDVIGRLRKKLGRVPGAVLYMSAAQEIRVGARQSNSDYQFSLKADDLDMLRTWEPKVREALAKLPELVDVNTDDQDKGLQYRLEIDRDAASRLGLTVRDIDTVLNNSFAQRLVSTIYNPLNQYRVVMGLEQEYLEGPASFEEIRFVSATGQQVPLSAFAKVVQGVSPLSVSHDAGFPDTTISYGLAEGVSLSQATEAITDAFLALRPPAGLQGSASGTAKAFKQSAGAQPLLILAAIVTIYLVLGMLYESLIHPLTILSTLPSAGVGALLALMAFDQEFGVIALIGVLLLIGIVKKNAIMMIDFAIDRQRKGHYTASQAIFKACVLRFRPILMTTLAAMLGALPLALGSGDGAELRNPLGISIVGGLILSQLLTLYTTPVVYVALDKLSSWRTRR